MKQARKDIHVLESKFLCHHKAHFLNYNIFYTGMPFSLGARGQSPGKFCDLALAQIILIPYLRTYFLIVRLLHLISVEELRHTDPLIWLFSDHCEHKKQWKRRLQWLQKCI